ncbi:1259_t:CDS:2 [Cetraspora pellucida]|uniref:1259_t:CDS:1 n=1 Tax=Cetraspora pellucida TaxID=1433469 RepID=A0A9N9HWW9_9GLOM|nr:1259_t:CDS:2 [Cetraspora pellucida]
MFQALEKIYEQDIDIRNAVKLESKKVSYSHSLELCKKALNIALINNFNIDLEDILQQFIDEQHRGKSCSANKRYLLATKNYNSKNIDSNY